MHQSFNDLKIQKLSGDIYQQRNHHNLGNAVSISAFKSDTKLVKMENERKKALIARLQNY